MDKIIIKGIEVFAFHGALPEENSLGQKFYIDLELYKDLKKAGNLDSLEDTVHYGMVHDTVVTLCKNNTYKLIEKVAEEIAKEVIKNYDINKIKVKIKKPNAPIRGHFEYVAVEIERNKNDYE